MCVAVRNNIAVPFHSIWPYPFALYSAIDNIENNKWEQINAQYDALKTTNEWITLLLILGLINDVRFHNESFQKNKE